MTQSLLKSLKLLDQSFMKQVLEFIINRILLLSTTTQQSASIFSFSAKYCYCKKVEKKMHLGEEES